MIAPVRLVRGLPRWRRTNPDAEEATVKTICAWCEHEGKTVVLAEREPADDLTVRYAICETHTSKLVSQLHKCSRPARSRPAA
jgi:hypothetical protein